MEHMERMERSASKTPPAVLCSTPPHLLASTPPPLWLAVIHLSGCHSEKENN
ncbi:hypothetical protein P171DRAFT_252223 [Karstenula rhodostoma CBS 690.94]|uniref:Uncharacterized protein n=1 Tax=Karstenula rhodostoma CBS 690.94 TaxID=1392251 RepID=A0A9P4PJA0_9PLEO|nr:hypothetical protein P171DRAFT_252223 [Karstenula rhodostoma CBS 690.94]